MTLGWSGPSPSLELCVRVCACPEAALMIVGNLTYAIVILMDVHGEAYQSTAGEKTLGGQMLREKALNYPNSTCMVFLFKKRRACIFKR